MRDGSCECFFPNGELKSSGIQKAVSGASVRVGEWRKYWEESGETVREVERFNTNGKLHGDHEFYNRDGNLIKRITYSNGEESGRVEY